MIMESTNNLHYLQDHQHTPTAVESTSSSSSLSNSSFFGGLVGGITTHSYNNNNSSNTNLRINAGGNLNQNLQELANNPRAIRSSRQENEIGVPSPRPLNNSMIQDLGYHHHWTSSDHAAEICLNSNSMKEEISVVGFPKFTEMLINSSSSSSNSTMEGGAGYPVLAPTTTQMNNNNNEHKDHMNALMLKTFLFTPDLYSSTNYPNNFGGGTNIRGNLSSSSSQIYPSINISNLNHQNNNHLDLLTTSPPTSFTTAAAGLNSQDHHPLARFTDNNLSFSLHHHMQHHHTDHRSLCSSNNSTNNTSLFTNGTAETKRPCTLIESKASPSQTAALKKSRSTSESRTTSCPPFKVRKEKLGDRIAALQQLVAPFGKTDTASVLMEAIGYIKFLQGQVETLSVPYMKPSQNHANRSVMQGGSGGRDGEAAKQDLRSRGLCLVPLTCMSYIAGDGGTEVWRPQQQQQCPNFGGGPI